MRAEPPQITLEPMSPARFAEWRDHSIRSFAGDVAAATGRPLDAALDRARRQFADLLPRGLDTDGVWLFTIVDSDGMDVGTLWLGPHPERKDVAFVYDIAIQPERRGHGLGRAAMTAAETVVLEAGQTEIGLNVFGFNDSARGLYDSLGYRVVATQMTKLLQVPHAD